jgi:hypothetical protein
MSMQAKWMSAALIGSMLLLGGCWRDTRSAAASFDGFRQIAMQNAGGIELPIGSQTYPTASAMPRTMAVVKVQSLSRYGKEPGCVETVEWSEDELEELARLGSHTVGIDAQPLSRLLPPGSRVQEEQLLAAAKSLNAEALLVVTYDTVRGHDAWIFPLLFTVGLAPTVNKSCESEVHGIIIRTDDKSLVFDGSGSDDGWQIANGYTAETAAEQVETRVQRRAFARLINRIIEGKNGSDVREQPEAMMGAW